MNETKIIKTESVLCPFCKKEHEVELCERSVNKNYKGVDIEYIEQVYRCSINNDFFYLNNMKEDALINFYDAYRRKIGLLTSKEIKSIRKKYKLTQAEFSLMLGFGEITVTRYETKQIQEFTNDNIMRQVNENAIFALKLLKKNKNKFSNKRYKEIYGTVVDLIDSEALFYLNEQEIISKYIKYNEKSIINGNVIIDIENLKNVLAYIVKKIGKTEKIFLMNILWYIDMLSFKNNGQAITGLVYIHKEYGTLPIAYDELMKLPSIKYDTFVDKDKYRYELYYNSNFKISNLLLDKEKFIIDSVVNRFKNYSYSDILSNIIDEKAYIETKQNEIISFKYAKYLNDF